MAFSADATVGPAASIATRETSPGACQVRSSVAPMSMWPGGPGWTRSGMTCFASSGLSFTTAERPALTLSRKSATSAFAPVARVTT